MLTKNFMYAIAKKTLGVDDGISWASLVAWNGNKLQEHSGYRSCSIYLNALHYFMTRHDKISQSDIPSEKYASGYFQGLGVCFGNGTTPPTENDHCMEGDLLTNYGYSQTYNFSKDSVTVTYTITNSGNDPFTISEVGLLTHAYQQDKYGSYYSSGILLDRTVLESPITIPAGGVGQVTYTIRMNGLDE